MAMALCNPASLVNAVLGWTNVKIGLPPIDHLFASMVPVHDE